jgi:hypothetical protein
MCKNNINIGVCNNFQMYKVFAQFKALVNCIKCKFVVLNFFIYFFKNYLKLSVAEIVIAPYRR